MNPKVSMIVPVYGVEKYIAECVESLLNQTYENLEILLIDDGGKDRSVEICEQYAAKDHRIKIIHKKNGGAASARNVGIDAATGEYLCFVDGDDIVEKDYVMHLWTALSQAGADISECGLYYWFQTRKEPLVVEELGVADRNDYLLRYTRQWICALMTNKLFKRTVVGDVRFEEGHCIDDEFFTYQVIMNCQTIVVTDAPLYGYRMRVSSVMHDTDSTAQRMMLDRIDYLTKRYTRVTQRYPQLEQTFFLHMVDTMACHWKSCQKMPKVRAVIRDWKKKYFFRILKMKTSLKVRLIYLYSLYVRRPGAKPTADTVQLEATECFQ